MSYDQPPPPPPPGYGYGYGQPTTPPPPNNLVWAILTTIFCCLPAGVVSIVYAAQVNSKWAQGDVAGAQKASQNART
jgi:Interferon-induced transmembrane protein